MRRANSLLTLTLILLVMSTPVTAQRIGIGEGTSSENQQNDTRATDTEKADPDTRVNGRIIPPEDFGKYRRTNSKESDLSKDALIEKLRADSAAMSIRFEETIRQLRSDSQAMRKKIKELRQRVASLKSQDTGSRAPELKRSDRDRTRLSDRGSSDTEEDASRSTQSDTQESDTQEASDSEREKTNELREDDEESSIASDRRLNPNNASLSDLKSIPDLSDRLAERIEWYRREVTPFEDLQDLKRVPGIDRQVFESIREYFHEGPY